MTRHKNTSAHPSTQGVKAGQGFQQPLPAPFAPKPHIGLAHKLVASHADGHYVAAKHGLPVWGTPTHQAQCHSHVTVQSEQHSRTCQHHSSNKAGKGLEKALACPVDQLPTLSPDTALRQAWIMSCLAIDGCWARHVTPHQCPQGLQCHTCHPTQTPLLQTQVNLCAKTHNHAHMRPITHPPRPHTVESPTGPSKQT